MSNERVTADVWVFDLDNTLYPRDCDLFAQIDVKMKAFVSDLLNIDHADAYRAVSYTHLTLPTILRV